MSSTREDDISRLTRWAKPMPQMGPAVYRLTQAPADHKHAYHVYCPWSPDQNYLLLFRYNRVDPEGEVCVMETDTGEIRVVGRTARWGCHNAARQQWAGDRVFYPAEGSPDGGNITGGPEGAEDCGSIFVTVAPDGSDEKRLTVRNITAPFVSPDGQWVVGGTPLPVLFPDDGIAPRADKGLFRINLENGEDDLLLSAEDALKLLPQAEAAEDCHLYLKMFIIHPRTNRILFNLTNTFWDLDGREPRVREIITVGLDGSEPRCLGHIAHHPNWHPAEDLMVANAPDCNGKLRFVLYPGDGKGLVDYVSQTKGSGHPSFSPDGRWLCTDAAGPETNQVIYCNPRTGASTVAMMADLKGGGGYRSFPTVKNRPKGETVTQALERCAANEGQTWQTQCHPAWSRDGSAVLVNFDLGDGSQLYVLDARDLESRL